MNSLPMTIERIRKDLDGIKARAGYGVIEGDRLTATLEYGKRGEYMVRDMEWLLSELVRLSEVGPA